jgi:hypothetical protein
MSNPRPSSTSRHPFQYALLRSALHATRAARQGSNPHLVAFVAYQAFARPSGAWADTFALGQFAASDRVGKVRLQVFSSKHRGRRERTRSE